MFYELGRQQEKKVTAIAVRSCDRIQKVEASGRSPHDPDDTQVAPVISKSSALAERLPSIARPLRSVAIATFNQPFTGIQRAMHAVRGVRTDFGRERQRTASETRIHQIKPDE